MYRRGMGVGGYMRQPWERRQMYGFVAGKRQLGKLKH